MVYDKFENKPLEAQDLLKYIEELHNEDFLIQYHGLVGLRKHLSVEVYNMEICRKILQLHSPFNIKLFLF